MLLLSFIHILQKRGLFGCEESGSYFEFEMLKDTWFEKSGRQGSGTQEEDPGYR